MLARSLMLGIAGMASGLIFMVGTPVAAGSAGTHPTVCSLAHRADKADAQVQAQMTEAIGSGNWPASRTRLIASFKHEGAIDKAVVAALKRAPRKLRRAEASMIGLMKTQANLAARTSSVLVFEVEDDGLTDRALTVTAETTLSAYFGKFCR